MLGGKLNVKLLLPKLEVQGNFKYVTVDGERGVLLVALGVTEEDKRAVFAEEEDYRRLLVDLWGKFNPVLVVADGVKALDRAISSSCINVRRQYCVVFLKRSMKRSEREELNEILFLAVKLFDMGVLNYLLAPKEVWCWLKVEQLGRENVRNVII